MSRGTGGLTRDVIRRLAAGESIADAGITAVRLSDGDVRWSVNVMVGGRRIHRVIGRESEGANRSDCEVFIERVRTEERAERLELPRGRKTWLSFRQVAERYLSRMEAGDGRNLKNKRPQINGRLIPYFGSQRAEALTEFGVNTFKKRRLVEGAAVGTVNRELATLRHMLRDAAKAKDIRAVPCTFAMLPEPPGRTIVLSPEQCTSLRSAARADQDGYVWLFVEFGLGTAMRHREILGARFDQIDWTRRRLHIPKAKAGAREQPLTQALVELLRTESKQRDDESGFVFPSLRGAATGHRRQMSKPFARVVKLAGLDPALVTPHTMRHTAITRLVQAGIDLPTIQRISGHKTLAMVLRYAHSSGAHIDAAMAALNGTTPEPEEPKENVAGT
ncbi:MAG TPA: site-specific integrase [Caulobacteraceae bacterium]|nr:site-specific integrase [Caulobacteraceae bacterium]